MPAAPSTTANASPATQTLQPALRPNQSTAEALSALRLERRAGGVPALSSGTSQGLEDAAAEALQILGQIIVDRATAEAYRLLKDKLEDLLGCTTASPGTPANGSSTSSSQQPGLGASSTSQAAPPAAPSPAAPATTSFTFPATCKVLGPLRLQDIATQRDALFGALASDGFTYMETKLVGGNAEASKIAVGTVLTSVIVPLVARPKLLADNAQAQAVVGEVLAYVDTIDSGNDVVSEDTVKTLRPAQTALVAGVLAFTRCAEEAAAPTSPKPIASCDFVTYANNYSSGTPAAEPAARAVAAQLVAAATLTTSQGQPDNRQRVVRAVDALFDSACMLDADLPTPLFACPSVDSIAPGTKLTLGQVLGIIQPIFDGALDGDSNATITALARVVEFYATSAYQKTNQRAFLLLGSLVQYAATFAETSGATAQQLHDQRTQILESLTQDMTDRTARDGDSIFSFGGSLRLVGGARLGGAPPALLGPLSLPIGIGFDQVSSGNGAGLHLEFGIFDLGQYIAYDNKATVNTPKVADAVAPSFTIAAGWGKSIPVILGATASYSPTFALSPTKDTKGTLNVGLTLGMYVPLIDMN
jgi:hypothetical protein